MRAIIGQAGASLLMLLIFSILVGCSTPYQSRGVMGGYIDQDLGEGMYHIEFKGNAYTSLGQCEEYFYRRAKELCTRKGYASYNVIKLETVHESTPLGDRPFARGIVQCSSKTEK